MNLNPLIAPVLRILLLATATVLLLSGGFVGVARATYLEPAEPQDSNDGIPSEEDKDNCDPPGANDGPDGDEEPCVGMAVWRVAEPYINLWLEDVPLRYRMGSGQWMEFKISYKQRGQSREPSIAGFGPNWTCDWIGYLVQTGTYITNYQAGGGERAVQENVREAISCGLLEITLAVGTRESRVTGEMSSLSQAEGDDYFQVSYPRGTAALYTNVVAIEQGTIHLRTSLRDRYGRATRFVWTNAVVGTDTISRLVKVIDKDGKESLLSYTNSSYPARITAIADPYGRTARFIYDDSGRLHEIIDTIGTNSVFSYDLDTGVVTNLSTAYGNTGFKFFEGTVDGHALNRAIEVSEPNGEKQLFAYRDNFTLVDEGPGGAYALDDSLLHYRNSYHWNRDQYERISAAGLADYLDMPVRDYWHASLQHWLLQSAGTGLSEFCAAAAGPVIDPDNSNVRSRQVFFQYTGQVSPARAGTAKRVVKIVQNGTSYTQGVSTMTEIGRNDWGRPTSITYYKDGSAIPYTQEYDTDGRRLLKVLGPNSELVRGYAYDATLTNLLVAVTNAAGQEIHYGHTGNVRLASIRYASGLVVSNYYYTSGPWEGFLQRREEVGFATNYFTWTNGNVHIQTNELGLVTTNEWDALNRLVAVGDASGYRSNLWDKLDLIGARDKLGNWTRYGYNAVRQLVGITNANAQATTFSYCGCGSPEHIDRSANGKTYQTIFTYDNAGRRHTATDPDGYLVTYTFDARDRLQSVSDGSNYVAQFEYDDLHQLTRVEAGQIGGTLLQWEKREYDQYGRLLRLVDRNGVSTTNKFDYVGRLLERRIEAEGAGLEIFQYTDRGLTNYFDSLGEVTRFVRDARGQALWQTNANNETLGFTYDPAGAIKSLEDGEHHFTRWNYDAYGRVTNKLDHLNQEMFRYFYDPEDRLTNRWQAALGGAATNVTSYVFDPVGNLTNIVYSRGPATPPVTLRYDGLNRLTNIVDAAGSTGFGWTDGGLLAYEDGPWSRDRIDYAYSARLRGGFALQQDNASDWVQGYGYDAYRRLTNVTSAAGVFRTQYKATSWNGAATASGLSEYLNLPGGSYIQNSHDAIGRLLSTALKDAQAATINSHGYEYNDGHQRTKQTFKEGNYVDYGYDKIGQLKTAKGKETGGAIRPHEQFGYAYDAAWNLNYRTNYALLQTFGVDSLNQLTTLGRSGTMTVAGMVSTTPTSVTVKDNNNAAQAAELCSDNTFARSNITLLNGNNTFQAIAEDSLGRKDTNTVISYLPSSISCSYDLRGNLTNDGHRLFFYDAENQLTNVQVAGAWKSEFIYDGFMRRRVRQEYRWDAGTSGWVQTNEVHYVYDGRLVVQERHYTPNGSSLIPLTVVTYTRGNDLSGTFQGAGGIGGLLARSDSSHLLSSISYLPSPHAYYHADGNGNVTAIIATNGLPLARYHYDPYGNILGMSGPLAEASLYRFSSKEWHEKSGLVYHGYRYYEPVLQRWINRDPLGEFYDLNLHRYVYGAPPGYCDPDGRGPRGTAIGGAVGTFVGGAIGGSVGAAGGTLALPGGGTVAGAYGLGAVGAMAGAALGGAVGNAVEDIGNLFRPCMGRRGAGSSLPTTGAPNSSAAADNGDGTGTIREYGGDGKAKTDYDIGHDHGAGDPHAHDWDWNSAKPRQPGRPLGQCE